ncbi:MAG: 1,6-anhydro-N-acetylmuramyl-L-alanine amidase AmpD [Proteobacteria bacterium]|jgi:N-acetyl-anhydromuramoyl-L-alanine amidase|nr:1,6-anhydro-N-acetylmuramyl-L-alanine amidase AmpD [Pseudomonadota bacterium]
MSWKIDAERGVLLGARQIASPNCDARPDGALIRLLVIHGISLPPGQFGGDEIERLFTNRLDPDAHPYFQDIVQLRVSSHLLICRTGEVVQFVPFQKRAWHAGESCYYDQSCCNDFSIGIELEGADDIPYTDIQYDVLGQLIPLLREAYPAIGAADIVGHCHIAPGRKTDPGPIFEWARLGLALPGEHRA